MINGGTLDITGLNVTFDAFDMTESEYVIVDWDIEAGEGEPEITPGILIGTQFASVPAGWTIDYNYMGDSQIVLMVDVSLIGDADENGVVNAADYIALKTNMGQATGATLAKGDFDGDGDVDWDDLQLLQAHYGETSPGAAGTIPEPATLGLLAIGALAVIRRRRRS